MFDTIPLIRMFSEQHARFIHPVVPLLTRTSNGRLEPHASGFLVSYRDRLFLVSAGHAFEPLGHGIPMFSFLPDQEQLTGPVRYAQGTELNYGSASELDVSVMLLEDAERITKPSLGINNLGADDRPTGGEHLVFCGFPYRKTEVKTQRKIIQSQPYAHTGRATPRDKYPSLGLNPMHHISMGFHTRKVYGLDGRRKKAPHPRGMSGGPIWIVRQTPDGNFGIGVIGVFTDYVAERKIMFGTTVAAAIAVIRGF
jgi:hypothetical protein